MPTIEEPLKKIVRQCNFLGSSIETARCETGEQRVNPVSETNLLQISVQYSLLRLYAGNRSQD